MVDLDMLEKLSLVSGISGYEKQATRLVKAYIEDDVDDIMYDQLGSLVAVKKGTSDLKVLLAAHIDEIGFIVKDIDDNGYIDVEPIGGWNSQNLPSSLMNITTREGKEIKGVFALRATQDDKNKVASLKNLYLDIGALSKQEAKDMGIRKSDPIVPVSKMSVMANQKCLMSKAGDDRIGVAVMIQVLKNLKNQTIMPTLYLAATVQEEVGLRGAKTVGQMVQPDLAIAIDVTFSQDLPGSSKGDVCLGSGVALTVMDASAIAHTGLLYALEDICEKQHIPYQLEMDTTGGTDSGELSKVASGVMNITVSIPSRYMHTHYTIIHQDDYEAAVQLLTSFLTQLDESLYQKMLEEKR